MKDVGWEEMSPESKVPTDLLSDILWQRAGQTSLEHFRLSRLPGSYALHGVVLSWADAAPRRVNYAVSCDPDWTTRIVHVTILDGPHVRRLQLERDGSGMWRRDAEVLSEFEGMIDIDLEITPATNTIPIRRLGLGVGEAADTDALWIRFPSLTLECLPQRYARTSEHQYRYESRGGAFRADLDVDDEGVVIRYGDVWHRVRG